MGSNYRKLEGDPDALKAAMVQTQNLEQYRRYQAVYLRLAKGMGVADIAEVTGYGQGWVRDLHSKYRRGGLEALKTRPKGGRQNAHLTLEAERALLDDLQSQGEAGSLLIAAQLQKALEAEVGKKVCKASVYNLLHRHGWRKIKPRPQHPQADLAAQAALKKNGQNTLY